VNINECLRGTHNCHIHATCDDNQGSFKCECDQEGPGDEWWGTAIDTEDGCVACEVCYDGYHEVLPCTSTTDRTCDINVDTGIYTMETEADDNLMCLAMLKGEWYPSRVNYGNEEGGTVDGEWCGAPGATEAEKKEFLMGDGSALFQIVHIGNKNDQEIKRGGDMYIIKDNSLNKCLFFGDGGKDLYPSLQSCHSYALDNKLACGWNKGNADSEFCGFDTEGMGEKEALMQNGQAVWRISPLKLNEKKYILQSASKGKINAQNEKIWECLTFEEQGAATNPSRYNWGNGDTWCGAGDWGGLGKQYALLNNKQAVFILNFHQTIA